MMHVVDQQLFDKRKFKLVSEIRIPSQPAITACILTCHTIDNEPSIVVSSFHNSNTQQETTIIANDTMHFRKAEECFKVLEGLMILQYPIIVAGGFNIELDKKHKIKSNEGTSKSDKGKSTASKSDEGTSKASKSDKRKSTASKSDEGTSKASKSDKGKSTASKSDEGTSKASKSDKGKSTASKSDEGTSKSDEGKSKASQRDKETSERAETVTYFIEKKGFMVPTYNPSLHRVLHKIIKHGEDACIDTFAYKNSTNYDIELKDVHPEAIDPCPGLVIGAYNIDYDKGIRNLPDMITEHDPVRAKMTVTSTSEDTPIKPKINPYSKQREHRKVDKQLFPQ